MERVYPRWTAKIWESGEFSFGYLPSKRPDRVELPPDFGSSQEDVTNICNCLKAHGLDKTVEFLKANPEYYPSLPRESSPLVSTPVPKSHSAVPRGQGGISTHGKRLVRNACLRLEREAGVKHLSFLTLTVPGVSPAGGLVLVENWASIVRVFQQRLKRHLLASGLPGEMVGVTEVQEKRLVRSGVVALHLHIVFQGRKKYSHWEMAPSEIRGLWRDTLKPYLDAIEDELYWDACENLVPVKSSASGYLGKYMSKGVEACKAIVENNPGVILPSCWYLCSNTLRRRVFQQVRYITSNDSSWFEMLCSSNDTQDVFSFIRPIYIKMKDGMEWQVGWVGRLTPQAYQAIAQAVPIRDNRFAVAEYL